SLAFDTGATASGAIGVRLLGEPHNVATADVASSVTFSGIKLTQSEINPIATGIAPGGGTPQGVIVNASLSAPLTVNVVDALGDPVANAAVAFTAPATGASAQLSAAAVLTDVNGSASVSGTANGIAGPYVILATVGGVTAPAVFAVNNIA